jgi:hypothetical protein
MGKLHEEIRKEAFPELDVNCFIGKPIANFIHHG